MAIFSFKINHWSKNDNHEIIFKPSRLVWNHNKLTIETLLLQRQHMAEIVLKRPFGDAGNVYIREIKLHVYCKPQTADSSWESAVKTEKEHIKTAQKVMDKKLFETTNLCVEIMNSKRQVKGKLGQVHVQICLSRLT